MSPTLRVLTHEDLDPEANPTGEALLDRARAPWRLWVPADRALVLGHSQDPERELHTAAAAVDGIPVFRRMGGGGAVLLSPACVCVALRFARPKGRTLHDFFAAGSGLIRRTFSRAYGLELETRGISDLAHAGPAGLRKVLGCSLYMPRDFALYLASILVKPDTEAMGRYLAHPSREPDYRAGRGHGDFVVTLGELAGREVDPEELVSELGADLDRELQAQLDWPVGQAGRDPA